MKSLVLKSPAKLNLHLRILRRRPDGYHDLLTVFHRISLCDTIRIRKTRGDFRLTTNLPGLETGEGNLITKAYRLLQARFPDLGGVSVRLDKKIPPGAGLGGGSSNAAHFLLGMKKMFRLGIPETELLKMGKKLGADVPFFLLDTPQAMAWGIGEKMRVLPPGRKLSFLLLLTDQGLNTKKVYQNIRPPQRPLSLTEEKRVAIILNSFFGDQRIGEAARLVRNDLEPSAFSFRPQVRKAIQALKAAGALCVLMSGSGPTVFAVLSSRKEAGVLARRLKTHPLPYRKSVCHTF
ncbi:MAG: 4-diphosphocytidyl-2-C-methyl-D-erythritol kinase [Candidatus Omnitrophica bacterium ADurb.Bin314]|jgi:4-diphosphocytidyl-2-C-methyl-D-erythritol kinase|nr:MAG: 4-diphosphocytidyl-2-C-methyl-D-erythritol kinase [Candidatus Omnitrophica bacterium ADurb.Bin314]